MKSRNAGASRRFRSIALAVLLFLAVCIYSIYIYCSDTGVVVGGPVVIVDPQRIRTAAASDRPWLVSEAMMKHGISTDEVDKHSLAVAQEIEAIKGQIMRDAAKGARQERERPPQRCTGSTPQCKFEEIARESPVALFIHSSNVLSRQFVSVIRATFDIYPDILVIDLDSDIDGAGIAEHIVNMYKPGGNSHSSLFINGKFIRTDSFQANMHYAPEQTKFYEQIVQLGMDNIEISKKVAPSNK